METATDPVPPPLTENERIHRYGYREIARMLPDGQVVFDRVGLTLEDLLHPRMGDKAVESSVHDLERGYLAWVFRARVADDPQALVLSDTGVFWDDPDLGHHSPDVAAIFGLRRRRANWTTFHVADEGTRPSVIVEVVSPDSRKNDVETKMKEYHQARVPLYFIVDRKAHGDPPHIRAFRWTLEKYQELMPNDDGRFWIQPLGIWIGIEGGTVACYDGKTGVRLGDYVEVSKSLDEAQKVAETEAKRAETEAKRADEEHRLRQQLEAEIQALREQLKKPHSNGG